MSLVMMTGFRAGDIRELLDGLKKVPESSVYYHTHHFLKQHQFLVQEPPNDFAYWVTHILNESKIGERLTAVDAMRCGSLEDLRAALIASIEPYLAENSSPRKVPPQEEFHFMKSMLFIMKTPYTAMTLTEFLEGLKNVSIYSLYYHLFEARLRTPRRNNDFSLWLESVGETKIAGEVARLDPYSQTMEDVRGRIIRLVEQRLAGGA